MLGNNSAILAGIVVVSDSSDLYTQIRKIDTSKRKQHHELLLNNNY